MATLYTHPSNRLAPMVPTFLRTLSARILLGFAVLIVTFVRDKTAGSPAG